MLTAALSLALAVSAGQAKNLDIVDAHPTFGFLGAPRVKGAGMLPGDVAHVSFQIKNLKTDANGKVAYSIAIVIKDAGGNVLFEQKPHNAVAQNFFGGDLTPAAARIELPIDSKPGAVNWTVTVKDRATGQSTSLSGSGKILPADFGLVQVGTFADPEAQVPVPPVGVMGGTLYLNFATVGFQRSTKTKQPDIDVNLRILDAKGDPTFAKPLTGRVNADVPEDLRVVPMQFGLTMNRVGTFTIELTARDAVAGKTSVVRLPVRVLALE